MAMYFIALFFRVLVWYVCVRGVWHVCYCVGGGGVGGVL